MAEADSIQTIARDICRRPKSEGADILRIVNRTLGVFVGHHLRLFKDTIVYCKGPAPANEDEWINLEDQLAPLHIETEEARFYFASLSMDSLGPIEKLARDIYNSPKADWRGMLFLLNGILLGLFEAYFGPDEIHHLRAFGNGTFVLCKGRAPPKERDLVVEEPAPEHVEMEATRFCFGPPPAHDHDDVTLNEQGKLEKGTASELTEKRTLFQVKSGVSKKGKPKAKGKMEWENATASYVTDENTWSQANSAGPSKNKKYRSGPSTDA